MKLPWLRRGANAIPEGSAAARLEARGLSGAKLWNRLRNDRWLLGPLLAELNSSRPKHAPEMTPGTLGKAIGAAAERDAARLLSPAWLRYLAGSAVILALVLLWLQARERQFHLAHPAPSLVAATNLRPYTVIADSDVRVTPASTDPKLAQTLLTSVRGRYPTRAVTAGSPLRADLLADAAAFPELSTRAIATLRVRHADAALTASLPARVTLAVPAADGAIECPDAYLLAFARETQRPSTATVALPPCGHERLGALLSAPAVTLMWDRRR